MGSSSMHLDLARKEYLGVIGVLVGLLAGSCDGNCDFWGNGKRKCSLTRI